MLITCKLFYNESNQIVDTKRNGTITTTGGKGGGVGQRGVGGGKLVKEQVDVDVHYFPYDVTLFGGELWCL